MHRSPLKQLALRKQLAVGLLLVTTATPGRAQTFSAVDSAARSGVLDQSFPAAVVVIGDDRRVRYAHGYGHVTWDAASRRPSPHTSLFDLASLTKVIGTTGVLARLVDRGAIDLDRPVQQYLPRFAGTDKERVTVRMLLDHTSGLRPFLRLYQLAPTPDSARTLIYVEPLSRPPGASPLYSDLNAILLGYIIEQVMGVPLDVAIAREVTGPLAMHHTRYRLPDTQWRLAVPTGRDAGEPVQGIVNDRNCDYLGGVTGHAGLFGTGDDLGRLAMAWLRAASGRDSTWIHAATARRFLARHPNAGTRLLGWDSRDTTAATVGSFGATSSARAFGHTGWTGTQIVIDPARNRWVVFLTNRSFSPRRTDTFDAIRHIRAIVVDAALGAGQGVSFR